MANPTYSTPFPESNYPIAPLDTKQNLSHPGQVSQTDQIIQQSAAQAYIDPPKYCGVRSNYQYELVIEQQPIRARMCGFGDKDRRPITPPPCVRVIVRDYTTGKEIPASEIDPTFFILSVDLWDEGATQEKNVVKTSSNTPAVTISTATTTSFPPQPERQPGFQPPQSAVYPNQSYQVAQSPLQPQPAQSQSAQQQTPTQAQQTSQPPYSAQPMYPQPPSLPSIFSNNGPGYYASGSRYNQPYSADTSSTSPAYSSAYPASAQATPAQQSAMSWPQSQTNQGMYTRNLIGSLTVNAFTLKDDQDRLGVWFVLQDLSVRTEAAFRYLASSTPISKADIYRLKMNFIDVGTHADPLDKANKLSQGKSPVLASVFSQPFQVFSAKKFPGVIESTPLSKCFAQQGIKIPIRKDGAKGEPRDDDGD